MVPSVCAAASKVSVPANVQLGIVMLETAMSVGLERDVMAVGAAAEVHVGTSLEMVTVAEGMSANMATLAVSVVGWMEGKTGPCAAVNVDVVGQDMNTMQGVSSILGVGTEVHLTFGAGMGTGMELVGSAGMGMGQMFCP